MIFDRHGMIIARSRPSFVVGLIPSEVTTSRANSRRWREPSSVEKTSLWHRLLHHRGVNYPSFDESWRTNRTARSCSRAICRSRRSRASPKCLTDLPGVDLEVQPMRNYPHGALGSHLFGYVGAITQDEYERLKYAGYSPNDVIGKDGLEFTYDDYLRGTPGGQRVVVDATGAVVSNINSLRKPRSPATRSSPTSIGVCRASPKQALADGLRTAGRGRALRRGRRRRSVDRRHSRACELSELQSQRLRGDRWKRVSFDLTDPRSRSSIARSPPQRRPDRRSRWSPARRR